MRGAHTLPQKPTSSFPFVLFLFRLADFCFGADSPRDRVIAVE